MNKPTRFAALILAGLFVGFGTGCGSKRAPPPEAADASRLSGAAEVMTALEKKDYDGAMAAFVKVRQSVATEEQQAQFLLLTRQMTSKMLEAAPTDPKAAEALAILRQITVGR